MGEKNVPLVKAVIHLADKTIVKGFLEDPTGTWSDPDSSSGIPLPEQFELRLAAGGRTTVFLSQAKAVFFVREFHGKPGL
jgi:hypothetical protein